MTAATQMKTRGIAVRTRESRIKHIRTDSPSTLMLQCRTDSNRPIQPCTDMDFSLATLQRRYAAISLGRAPVVTYS